MKGSAPDSGQSPWSSPWIAELRRQLEETGVWPAAADRLLIEVIPALPPKPDVEPALAQALAEIASMEENVMLSVVVNDALAGVDVATRYPTLYHALLVDKELHEAFLEVVALLSTEQKAAPRAAAPSPATTPLPFLSSPPAPAIKFLDPKRWHAAWQLLRGYLEPRLSAPTLAPGYRRTSNLLEDDVVNLLRSTFVVGEIQLQLTLNAIRPATEPDVVHLQGTLAAATDPLPDMQVTIEWGNYRQTAIPDRYGRFIFPSLSLDQIQDEAGRLTAGELQLRLEPR
jgi:hypothetical protein